jgi:parvulin-like peptidyl-prolyl isomerase
MAVGSALVPTRPDASSLSTDTVAFVNRRPISQGAFRAAAVRLAGERVGAMQGHERDALLDFLIDEELLVQRAVELGLVRSDRSIRSAIVMAVIDDVVAEVLAEEPSEDDLRGYYASHAAVFTRSARWHVRDLFFEADGSSAGALARAQRGAAAIRAGMSFDEVRARHGARGSQLPDGPVPVRVLRRHLGPALTGLVQGMPSGAVSEPIESPAGVHIVRVVAVQPKELPRFEDIEDVVRREYLRRARDTALDERITSLQARAEIVRASDAPR